MTMMLPIKHFYSMLWLFFMSVIFLVPLLKARPTDTLPSDTQFNAYVPDLKHKKIALVINHTAVVKGHHLVDILLQKGVNIVKILAPEHGFRGACDANVMIDHSKDEKTGLPILSLYGKIKEPTAEMLKDVDIVVFDIQDVGVRCYTYGSTLHHVMTACAKNKCKLYVLDRPNPNGHYIDGPILEMKHQSFVGQHPIPLVHGLTLGELALMINGQGWLKTPQQCDLKVIKMKNYTHKTAYILPIPPSPNLSTTAAIRLYPHLVLFEGTIMSVGRGTSQPFQVLGYPHKAFYGLQAKQWPDHWGDSAMLPVHCISFTPQPIQSMHAIPKYDHQCCYGLQFTDPTPYFTQLDLRWLYYCYQQAKTQGLEFFGPTFDHHAGSTRLREQLQDGTSLEDIVKSWQPGLKKYQSLYQKYVLYP